MRSKTVFKPEIVGKLFFKKAIEGEFTSGQLAALAAFKLYPSGKEREWHTWAPDWADLIEIVELSLAVEKKNASDKTYIQLLELTSLALKTVKSMGDKIRKESKV